MSGRPAPDVQRRRPARRRLGCGRSLRLRPLTFTEICDDIEKRLKDFGPAPRSRARSVKFLLALELRLVRARRRSSGRGGACQQAGLSPHALLRHHRNRAGKDDNQPAARKNQPSLARIISKAIWGCSRAPPCNQRAPSPTNWASLRPPSPPRSSASRATVCCASSARRHRAHRPRPRRSRAPGPAP